MGVSAMYCRLCGLPMNHEHYVAMGERLGIHRDDPGSDVPSAVTFTAEHAWLAEAVALRRDTALEPVILSGRVSNGVLLTGSERGPAPRALLRRVVLHEACYWLAGRPTVWATQGYIPPAPELAKYTQQLFDFPALFSDGLESWVRDPRGPSEEARRNRKRIVVNVEIAQGLRASPVPKLPDLLRFCVSNDAQSLTLRPGVKPVVQSADGELGHDFIETPENAFFNAILVVLTAPETQVLRTEGEITKTFGAPGLGWFRLEVYGDAEGDLARFTRVPSPT